MAIGPKLPRPSSTLTKLPVSSGGTGSTAIVGTTDMRPRLNLTNFLDFALRFLLASTPSLFGVDRWYQGDYRCYLKAWGVLIGGTRGTVDRSHGSHQVVPPKSLLFPRGTTGPSSPIAFGSGAEEGEMTSRTFHHDASPSSSVWTVSQMATALPRLRTKAFVVSARLKSRTYQRRSPLARRAIRLGLR